MSQVVVTPEALVVAVRDLLNIDSALSAANGAAAAIVDVLAPGNDEVSEVFASLLTGYGQTYEALSAHAAAFHGHFMYHLNAAAAAYWAADAQNDILLARDLEEVYDTSPPGG